ncbi:Pseudouridine synthase, RsuA/RluA-like [Dillenia turbinata]|uniref:Pseudouridine synthase, RsuA/RluA-like n=1 Tax=Dillenia turbinata TaxID=194707 RepID=A0AAN8ZTA7_9MAGN
MLRGSRLQYTAAVKPTFSYKFLISGFRNHHQPYSSTAAEPITAEERENRIEKKEGKWVTLPPFTPTLDATTIGKKLAGGSFDADTESATTALKWVLRCCPNLPRSLVQKLFRLRQVRREFSNTPNDFSIGGQTQGFRLRRVAAKDVMNVGDRIFLPITVQDLPSRKHESQFNEEAKNFLHNLELYKDAAIIVFNKPPGMPVQGGIGIKQSLDEVAGLYCKYDYSEPPRLVHRLDRDSSGILVMGRTQTSTRILHSIFREKTFGVLDDDIENKNRTLRKRYLALVIGSPQCPKGVISAPLGKVVMDNGNSERITVIDNDKDSLSQLAITEYRVIQPTCHGLTWLELSPLTGRKHQLRVHCAEVLRTPIVGDLKYGWQAHKKWKPLTWSNYEVSSNDNLPAKRTLPYGLDLEKGSVTEKQPRLHLHCKQMLLPNISLALELIESSSDHDLSKLDSLELTAPLPLHMQRSWEILKS